jgi:hypothetical protein
MILAIDPGNIESGFVVLDSDLRPIESGKIKNEELLEELERNRFWMIPNLDEDGFYVAIEMIASMGMAVGQSVFETCVWIGRFTQALSSVGYDNVTYIYRKDEKMNICGSMKAKDSNIIQALIDRFAPNTSNKGKGTKKNPGWFYGFKKDIWQAYAVAVTYYDRYIEPNL